MAIADYQPCQVCSEKAFYDATLNYEFGTSGLHDLEGRDIWLKLDHCAQVAAICEDCFKAGWRLRIERQNTPERGER